MKASTKSQRGGRVVTSYITVQKSRIGGRGVFATKPIIKGEMLEVCPVVPLGPKEFDHIAETKLHFYAYTWPGPRQDPSTPDERCSGAAIVLGCGMLYNHSFNPNAEWERDVAKRTMTFYALRTIEAGEEIFHDYGWPDWMYESVGIEVPE